MRSPHMTSPGCPCSGSNFSGSSDLGEAPFSTFTRDEAEREARPRHLGAPVGWAGPGHAGGRPEGPARGPGTRTRPGQNLFTLNPKLPELRRALVPGAPDRALDGAPAAQGARPYLRHGDCSGPERRRRDVGLQDRQGPALVPGGRPAPRGPGSPSPLRLCPPRPLGGVPPGPGAHSPKSETRNRSLQGGRQRVRARSEAVRDASGALGPLLQLQATETPRPARPCLPRAPPPASVRLRGARPLGLRLRLRPRWRPGGAPLPQGGTGLGRCPGAPWPPRPRNRGPSRLLGCLSAGTVGHCAGTALTLEQTKHGAWRAASPCVLGYEPSFSL